jgi:hypothetical protein
MEKLQKMSLLLAGLMLITFATTVVTATNEYNYDWETDAAPWAFWGLTGAFCFIPVVMFIIWIVLAIWVYKDAEKRDSSGALWLIIVIITGIIGLIIWLIVRPPIGGKKAGTQASSDRRCPGCGRTIPDDAQVCPYCGKQF